MMRGRVWLPLIVLAASLLVQRASATDFQKEPINLTPFVGWTFFDKELKADPPALHLDNDLYWGGRLGVRLVSPLWLDFAGGYVQTTGYNKDTHCPCEATWTHLSANLMLESSKPRAVVPFVSLGLGMSKFVPRWSSDDTDGTFEAAVGAKVKISNSLGVRLEARNVMLLPEKHYSDAHINNVVAGAGLVFAFGGKENDADMDGVTDKKDKCPDTPHGCTVDASGCPIDSDGDGVWDGIDRCPNTPVYAHVDEAGCPKDTDGDGVYDGIDRCPTTPAGVSVNADGCPKAAPLFQEKRDTLVLEGVHFETGKATLTEDSKTVLDIVARSLTDWPEIKVEVGGHTDSRGSDKLNNDLSQRRADSVRAYLIERGVPAERLSAKGYGKTKPIADNATDAGRAKNRRVELKRR
jgi:OmpA-OmpF porin, OOP family